MDYVIVNSGRQGAPPTNNLSIELLITGSWSRYQQIPILITTSREKKPTSLERTFILRSSQMEFVSAVGYSLPTVTHRKCGIIAPQWLKH